MTKDELLSIARDAMKLCGGDRQKAIEHLSACCELDKEIMAGMAKYGAEIVDAMIEAKNNTKQ